MGLRNWLDDVIPNELKGNLGKIAAIGTAAYFGYKGVQQYAPQVTSAVKGFIGQPSITKAPNFQEGTGIRGFVSNMQSKYPKTMDFVKGFGQQVAGVAGKGETESESRRRFAEEQERINRAIMTAQYSRPTGVGLQNVGTFQASQVASPGFNNSHVQESLNMVAYFMQDLRDNGRIDSSALYAEQTRGTTISLPTSKSLKMSI